MKTLWLMPAFLVHAWKITELIVASYQDKRRPSTFSYIFMIVSACGESAKSTTEAPSMPVYTRCVLDVFTIH